MVYCAAFQSAKYTLNALSDIRTAARNGVYLTPGGRKSVTLSSLLPYTQYDVYCTAVTLQGVEMSLAAVRGSAKSVRTLCCKTISVKLLTLSLIENAAAQRGLSITHDAPPSSSVSAQIVFRSSTGAAVVSYPSTTTFSGSDSAVGQARFFTLIAGSIGTHTLEVMLSGPSAAEYNVSYASSRVLTVLAADVEPSTPQPLSAVFSNDGSAVTLTFDAPTDKGGYFNAFPCAKLLNFSGNAMASCQWSDSTKITIYPTFTAKAPTNVLRVDSPIVLFPGNIRAACTNSNTTKCRSWATVPRTPLQVVVPPAPMQPAVIVSVPTTLGGCSSLTVDLTGSTGASGRPWSSIQFRVLTTLGASTAAQQLESYLTANFTLNPPTTVPYSAFQKGFTYSIQATLCNFLGSCTSAGKSVTVLTSLSAVPVVSILGQSQRSVYRSSQQVLNSNAYTQSCSGAVSSSNLDYTWTIRRLLSNGTLTTTSLRSSSQSPTVFKLPAFSLSASTQYEVTLSVKSLVSALSASATVTMSVQQGSLVATVLGGSTKQLKVGDSVQLDASHSYDEDVPSKKGDSASLSFLWTCVQLQPVFSATCVLLPTEVRAEKLPLLATFAAMNTTSLYTVTVSDGVRSSTAQVTVIVTGASSPQLDITNTVAALVNINTDKQLALYGSLLLYAPCTAFWSVDAQDIVMSEVARTPPSKYLVPSAQVAIPFNMVIKEGSLPQRSTLVFSLTCGSTSTSVTVTTNGAPLPGEFIVFPPSGDELSTVFTLIASQWSDVDLPLTYQFGFQSVTSLSNLVIVSKSEVAHAATTLPAGAPASSFSVTCSLQVFDSIGAFTSVQESATVRQVSAEKKEESLLKLLESSTGSVDSTKNVISVVSSALNSVNCSAVQNCSSLNRNPCLRTSGECGACLSGYIGDAGDRSSLCIPVSELRLNSSQLCSATHDCEHAWQVCDAAASTCVPPPKSCSRNCTHNGECIYVNRISGNVQPTCRLDDLNCDAVCSCTDQYSGAFCEISVAALRNRREVRSNLITSLHNLTAIEDISVESVGAWSASLYTLSVHPHELSTSDISAVASIANITLRSAINLGVESYTDVLGLLQATDTIASLQKYNYNPNDYNSRDFNSSRVYVNNTAAAIVHTVTAFSDLVARSMVLGQNSTILLYDNFRLSVHLDTVASGAGNITISTPQSAFELLTGAPPSTVKLSPGANNTKSNTVAVSMITVYPRAYSPDTSAFVSSPLMLQVQAQAPSGEDETPDLPFEYLSNVEFTFQHNAPQYQYLHHDAVNFTTVCSARNESEQHSHVCPESGHVLTHNCSQGAGVHTSYCPKPAPGCAKLDVDSADVIAYEGCSVVSYNLTYTTCSCPVRNNAAQQSSRRHLSTTEESLLDDSGAANMLTSIVFIAEDFANTFSAADDFNSAADVKKVLVVIIMLGALWVPALAYLGIQWFYTLKAKVKEKPADVDVEAQRSVIAYIESTIPDVFDAERSAWSRLWSELLAHHDLFRLLGKHTHLQRRLAVGKMLTVLTFLLFLTAVFFDVSNPGDDGSCVNHYSEESCLKRTSPFDYAQTYCQWSDEVTPATSQCTYKTQSMSMTALFYLTVLTTVLTAIATIPIEYLFTIISAPTAQSLKGSKVMNVVKAAVQGARRLSNAGAARQPSTVVPVPDGAAAPAPLTPSAAVKPNRISFMRSKSFASLVGTAEDKVIANREVPEHFTHASDAARASIAVIAQSSRIAKQRTSSAAVSLKARSTKRLSQLHSPHAVADKKVGKDGAQSIRGAENVNASAPAALSPLCSEVIEQRLLMNDGADETIVFDAQWGVLRSEPGEGYQLSASAMQSINDDVVFAREEAMRLGETLLHYNVHHAGLEILHLFMVDLLGRNTPAAKIFQEKFGEEFGNSQVVVMAQKYVAAALLLGLNAFFAYFILLKAFQKGYEWQIQYLVCSIVQFVIELLIFETTECVWLNYSVPSFVHKEVATAARKLRDHVNDLVSASGQSSIDTKHNRPQSFSLDAPPYLFVSAQVANRFPNMMESMIVSSYSDHLPGEICRTWPHYQATDVRQQRADTVQRDSWTCLAVPVSLIRGVTLSMQLFLTIPYLYQRVIIRFVQPVIFSGISVVWFIAVQSMLSAVVIVALFGAGLLYMVWRQYKAMRAQRSVVPAAGEDHSRAEDTVAIDIHPIPTFIQYDESSAESSESSVHLSSESESHYASEYEGSEWEDQDQDQEQGGGGNGGADDDAATASVEPALPSPIDTGETISQIHSHGSNNHSLSDRSEEALSVLEEKPVVPDTASYPSAPSESSEIEDVNSSHFDNVSSPTEGSEYDEYLFGGGEQEGSQYSHEEEGDRSGASSINSDAAASEQHFEW